MQKYINAIADKNGKPVVGASVLVQSYPSGSTATIYSDNGVTPISNPVTTDSNGAFAFYAADGRYSLQISGSSFPNQTINDILLEDPTDGGSPGAFTTLTVGTSGTIAGSAIQTAASLGAPGTAAIIGSSAGTVQTDIDARPTSSTLAASGGAALVGFIQSGTGAVARTMQSKERDVVSVMDFGAKFDGVTDDTTAINAALTYAASFVITNADTDSQQSGGLTVTMPKGIAITSAPLVVAPGVSLKGAGKFSTVIQNTTTTAIRNSLGAVYNAAGSQIEDLSVFGSRTASGQYGIDLLRWINGVVRNVFVQNTGAGGFRFRQCILCTFDQIESLTSAGPGILTGQGVNSWTDSTLNNLPMNTCIFTGINMNRNDGPGVRLGPYTNGCTFYGGAVQNNYATAGNGYNIELINDFSYIENSFVDVWTEGPVGQAHVLQNATPITVTNRLIGWKHFPTGSSTVSRAAIVNSGTLVIEAPFSTSTSYPTINSSTAPFRLAKPNGIIYLRNPTGNNLASNAQWVEDSSGLATGLENYLYQTASGVARGNKQQYYVDNGAAAFAEYYATGDANPIIRMEPFYKAIAFGPGGATAPDVRVGRRSSGVFGPMSASMSLGVDGTTGATLQFSNNVANGVVGTTFGALGPVGANPGNQVGWLRINVSGTDHYVPYW